MGEPINMLDLARDTIRLSGFTPEKDIKIEITGLRNGDKLYEELLTDEEGLTATRFDKIFVGKSAVGGNCPPDDCVKKLRAALEIQDDAAVISILREFTGAETGTATAR
jgi:FlaA1/EpsC-like NDP-sugar epimerase